MTDPPRDTAKRFGWIEPHPEKGEGHINIYVQHRDLPVGAWAEFEEIVGVIAEIRPYLIDFLALERDFEEVNNLEAVLRTELETLVSPFTLSGVTHFQAYVTAQRALSNFLAAASAFRDRARKRLIERYGMSSTEIRRFDLAVTDAYDGSFAYRLLYNLRNFSQHHASPMDILPIQGKRNEAGKMLISVQVELRRDDLLSQGKKIQSRVRRELADQPTNIALGPLANDYMRQHGDIFTSIAGPQAHRLTIFIDYARTIIEKSGMPEGATPLIWDGPLPKTQENFDTSAHGFSFDEMAFLIKTLRRLRADDT